MCIVAASFKTYTSKHFIFNQTPTPQLSPRSSAARSCSSITLFLLSGPGKHTQAYWRRSHLLCLVLF